MKETLITAHIVDHEKTAKEFIDALNQRMRDGQVTAFAIVYVGTNEENKAAMIANVNNEDFTYIERIRDILKLMLDGTEGREGFKGSLQ